MESLEQIAQFALQILSVCGANMPVTQQKVVSVSVPLFFS